MTKSPNLKDKIEKNHDLIDASINIQGYLNDSNALRFIPRIMRDETEILFQYPDHLPAEEKDLYLDFTNMGNMGHAWKYVLENKSTHIDYLQIKHVHTILAENTDIPGGIFRVSDAYTEQLRMHAPKPSQILYRLQDIEYNLYDERTHIINRAINAHYDLIELQAFNDFNKRTARLIMNWALWQNGYRPILFNVASDNQKYMDALRAKKNGQHKEYSQYMQQCMIRTQKYILNMLKKHNKKTK